MESPLVSIITNTLNRADLIHRCIESIQNQTYQNYEHIIVDGNSTDNTEEIVRSYQDPHIKYIKLDTRGPQLQMRAGANIARGKYVTFLDDDDEYLPTKIQKQVELFETEPDSVGVVYCWMSYYDASNPNVVIKLHNPQYKGYVGDLSPISPTICGTPTMMIRRDVFESVGGCFDDSIGHIGSDWELMARITQLCDVDFVPESLIKVYVNHGHARLTTNFYQEKAKKSIVFHTHFLKRFSNVFERNPQSAYYHYYWLCRNYAILGNRKDAFKYLLLYVKSTPSLKDTIKLLIGVIIAK